MSQTCSDPDPYAELDNRADAWELAEDFRKRTETFAQHHRHRRITLTNGPGVRRRMRL